MNGDLVSDPVSDPARDPASDPVLSSRRPLQSTSASFPAICLTCNTRVKRHVSG